MRPLIFPSRFLSYGAGNIVGYNPVTRQGYDTPYVRVPVDVMGGAVALQIPALSFQPAPDASGVSFHTRIC